MERFRFVLMALALILALSSCGVSQPSDRYTDYRTGKTFADRTALLENAKKSYPAEYDAMFEIAKEYPNIYDVYANAHEGGFKKLGDEINFFDETGNQLSKDSFHEILAKDGVNADFESVVPNYYAHLVKNEYRQAFEFIDKKGFFARAFSGDPAVFEQEQAGMKTSAWYLEAKVIDAKIVKTASKPMIRVFFKVLGFYQNIKTPEPKTNPDGSPADPPAGFKPPTSPEEAKKLAEKMSGIAGDSGPSWEYKYSGVASMLLGFSEGKWLINEQP